MARRCVLQGMLPSWARAVEDPLPRPRPEDWRRVVRARPARGLVIVLVDASSSMGSRRRMAAAKGAVLALLGGAHARRDRVALISFRGETARVLLRPTGSVELARRHLRRLATGGLTPFAHGLFEALRMVEMERARDPALRARLVVLSDGDANVKLGLDATGASSFLDELLHLGRELRGRDVQAVLIDTGGGAGPGGAAGPYASVEARAGAATVPAAAAPRIPPGMAIYATRRRGEMARLAEAMGGPLHHLADLRAGTILAALRPGARPPTP